MPPNLARIRVLLFEVPRTAKLAYSLLRDDRVPLPPKVAVGAALGLIVGPIDIPRWVPVIGDLDLLALAVLAVRVFIDACPEEIVAEHRAALARGEDIFDRDLSIALAVARQGVRSVAAGRRPAPIPIESRESEEEPA